MFDRGADDAVRWQHRRCIIPQSSAPEDGRNYRPKHVELIEIINKSLFVASSWLFILLELSCFMRQDRRTDITN